jgi:hypothetical protein
MELFWGFVLGIVGSFISWALLAHTLKPKVSIRPTIETYPDRRTGARRYRFGIVNARWLRSAIDVTVIARVAVRDIARTGWRGNVFFQVEVDDRWIPVLRSRLTRRRARPRGAGLLAYPMKPVLLLDTIEARVRNMSIDNWTEPLALETVLRSGADCTITLYVTAFDSFSGSRNINSRTFRVDDIVEMEPPGRPVSADSDDLDAGQSS